MDWRTIPKDRAFEQGMYSNIRVSLALLKKGKICLNRREIRVSASEVYRRGGTLQAKSTEITYQQIQKELGLGVNPHD